VNKWVGSLVLVSIVCTSAGRIAAAQPHEHGTSELLAALDGGTLTIEFSAPGEDIVGYEHAPETTAQKMRHDGAMDFLRSVANVLRVNAEASCRIGRVQTIETLAEEHGHHENEHGAIRLRYSFECENPDKLKSIELLAFQEFPGMSKSDFRFIGPRGQVVRTLTRKSSVAGL